MSKALNIAVAAIRDAVAADKALADAKATARSSWLTAYARSKDAQENGVSQADIGKGSGVGAVTVGDMLTASAIPASGWDILETLPARQGRRFTTMHSLVAAARKASTSATVRAIIADAAGKVAGIPRVDGAEPDADQVAKAWATCVRKLWETSGKKKESGKKDQTPPADPPAGNVDDDNEETGETAPEPQEPPTLDKRLAAYAAESRALQDAIAHGAACSRESMAAAMQGAGALARDLAEALSNTARATA